MPHETFFVLLTLWVWMSQQVTFLRDIRRDGPVWQVAAQNMRSGWGDNKGKPYVSHVLRVRYHVVVLYAGPTD